MRKGYAMVYDARYRLGQWACVLNHLFDGYMLSIVCPGIAT